MFLFIVVLSRPDKLGEIRPSTGGRHMRKGCPTPAGCHKLVDVCGRSFTRLEYCRRSNVYR